MEVKKAVILAGGRGTRFLPYTKACAKEMIALVDKPSLQYIVEEVVGAGIRDILIIETKNKPEILKHFTRDYEYEAFLEEKHKPELLKLIRDVAEMADVKVKHQEQALGSGHAVLLAEEFADGQPIAVLNGDDIFYTSPKKPTCIGQIAACYNKHQITTIGVQEVTPEAVCKYCSCAVTEKNGREYRVNSVIEKPKPGTAPSNIAALGRYVVSPDFFDYLRKTPYSDTGELYLTDAFKLQAQEKGIYAYEFDAFRYDMGDKLGYLKATVDFALRDEKLKDGFKEFILEVAKRYE